MNNITNLHPQVIRKDGHPAFIVIPYDEYQKMLELLEDLEDIREAEIARRETVAFLPLEIVQRLCSPEESPIKVLREYRNMSQTTLAKKLKVSRQYVSQLEAKQRKGTVAMLKKIAKALKVDLDDLV